jgi:hypothetical protein
MRILLVKLFSVTFVPLKTSVLLALILIMQVANNEDTNLGEEHMSSTRFGSSKSKR